MLQIETARHARTSAGVLGDARHGARCANVAALDARVRTSRRAVEEILQPAEWRSRVSETFQEYSARMLSLSAGRDPLAVLEATPKRIAAFIAGRGAADLRRSPGPGRWSVSEIIAHLADAEIVGAYRFRMI